MPRPCTVPTVAGCRFAGRRFAAAVAFAAAAFSGCDFQAPVDIDLPAYDLVLVVGGFVEAGALVEVRFGESRPAESDATAGAPWLGPGVVAVLYDRGGQALDTLEYHPPDPGGIYPRYLSRVVARPGETYELRATAPGLPPVRSVARVPTAAPLDARPTGPITVGGVPYESAELTWQDPPGATTYAVTSRSLDERSMTGVRPFASTDPALRDRYSGLGRPREVSPEDGARPYGYGRAAYLTDGGFEGAPRSLRLLFGESFGTGDGADDVSLCLAVLSPEMVRYMTALDVQQETASDPFVEPTEAYTNVEGGLGAFAGYATSCRELSL